MLIFKEKQVLAEYLRRQQDSGRVIGFVPTMGAIHEGHLSLVAAAKGPADVVVCSIFVNPTQFNDPEDLKKYPVDTAEDIRKLTGAGTDILFLPSVPEIYPQGLAALEEYPFGPLETVLEGAFRPGHFQGVGQVMDRLLRIIRPDLLFMGRKDYQQTLIISKLIDISSIKTKLVICPVLREENGLAMSSRNARLSPGTRRKAALIHETLQYIKSRYQNTAFDKLLKEGKGRLEAAGFNTEYLVITDGELTPAESFRDGKLVCLVAVWADGVRLIDNMILT